MIPPFPLDERRRRLALVIEKYPPFIGGAERQAELLARLLSGRLGSCDVFTAQRGARSAPGAARLHGLGTARRIALRHPLNLAAGLLAFARRGRQYAVVHAFGLSGLACGAVLGASARGCATVVKLCAVGPEGDVAKLARHPVGRHVWPMVRRRAAFVVPSPQLVSAAVAAGVPPDRIAVIPNALAPETAAADAPPRADARARLGLPERLTVLFVGRLVRDKGLDVLAQAWDRFAADRDATLVIVGDGPGRADLERWARRAGHGERVRLAGARPDVQPYYRAADVLVVPSRTETFCNVLAEGMAHGLAAITTPVGLAVHWIRDGDNGLLVPVEGAPALAGALAHLAGDAALRARLGRAARRDARTEFAADAVTDHHVELYERLLSGAPRAAAV